MTYVEHVAEVIYEETLKIFVERNPNRWEREDYVNYLVTSLSPELISPKLKDLVDDPILH